MKKNTVQFAHDTQQATGKPNCNVRRLSAFSVIETSVGIFMLSLCLVAFAQVRSIMIGERLRLGTTEQARGQLRNVLELLADVPKEAFVAGTFPRKEVDTLVANSFPNGKLTFEVIELVFRPEVQTPLTPPAVTDPSTSDVSKPGQTRDPSGKNRSESRVTVSCVRVTLSWSNGSGKPARSVTLTKMLL